MLDCSYNALTSLNISCNNRLASLDCSGNSKLAKVWVKDEAQSTNTAIKKDDATTIYYNNGGVNIPDAALKAYLVNNYDDDGDGEISIAESDNITMVNCSGKGVSDLTGLEACTNLVTLNCANNNITTIELPHLAQLTTLTCYGNPIERINLDNCVALGSFCIINSSTNAISGNSISISGYNNTDNLYFTIRNTPFTSFTFNNSSSIESLEYYGDFTDVNSNNNTALTSIVFFAPVENVTLTGNTVLESIDVSALQQLKSLNVDNCNLQSLDVTKNLALTSLVCSNNALATINVTQNILLGHLNVSDNQLSVINVRNNTALTYLNISNNVAINTVNVKNNTALTDLYAEGLSIVDINLSCNNAMTNANLRNNSQLETLIVWDACIAKRNDHLHFDMGSKYVLDAAGNHYGYPFKVGQFIPWFNGGVVYETSNNGANGKIISLNETSVAWGLYGTTTGAKDSNNGWTNVQTMKTKGYFTQSPAFLWCENYGKDDWYLPALNELSTIYNKKSTINSTLQASNYTTLGANYWSSTENSISSAYEISFSNGDSYYTSKSYTHGVRAILAF